MAEDTEATKDFSAEKYSGMGREGIGYCFQEKARFNDLISS